MDGPVQLNQKQILMEVIEACGEWFVRVVEDSNKDTRSLELESCALAFAEGQRLRLHVS
ncbi:hypothetical protein [Mesorhizobium sp. M1295]|uniref:hypothetical protein n=1 Tax=Mesorhizobium sp. M1295 TaxID=2957076 RepID=UPI00333DE427